MASVGDAEDSFDIDTKVQMHGLLLKQPFGHKARGKWQKRFFIIKEGFILYYGEAERKNFEKSHHFNIHPKGVIPLGGCTVKTVPETGEKVKYAMVIEHRDFKGTILLSADSEEERDKWMEMIRNSGRVTWKNAQLGDVMISQLEQESRKMADQQEKVKEQLQTEASALAEEKGKKEDLEKRASDLAREKSTIEAQLAMFQEDKEVTMGELHETLETLRQVKQDKESITQSLQSLQDRFKELSQEKELTAGQLEERNRIAQQLEEEKEKLALQTQSLSQTLESVESAKEKLAEEHRVAEELLLKESEKRQRIEREKKRQSQIVQEQDELIKIVEQEKQEKEKAYLTEKKQRVATEKRLRLAEDSLKRVDRALRESGINLDIEIELDVQNLRKFFEEAAAEAQLDADKPQIMREAVLARTSYVRKSGALTDEGSPFGRKSPSSGNSPQTSPLVERKSTQGRPTAAVRKSSQGPPVVAKRKSSPSHPAVADASESAKAAERPVVEEPLAAEEPGDVSQQTE